MGHHGDIRTLKMSWQGRTLLSRVLRKVRVDLGRKWLRGTQDKGLGRLAPPQRAP